MDVKEGKVTEKTLKMEENKRKRGKISVCSQWNLDEDKHVVQPVAPLTGKSLIITILKLV